MGYKVFEAPGCYNGEPLAKTLALQANSNLNSRKNRGIVSVTILEMLEGLKKVFWSTPKVMTILCVIFAALGSCLYGVYQLNLW